MNRYSRNQAKSVWPIISLTVLLLLSLLVGWLYFNDEEQALKITPLALPEQAINQNETLEEELINQPINPALSQSDQSGKDSQADQNQVMEVESFETVDQENKDVLFIKDLENISAGLSDWVNHKDIVKKFIRISNDLSQNQIIYKHRNEFKLTEKIMIKSDAEGLYIDPNSYHRYDALVNAIEHVDVNKCVQLYQKYEHIFNAIYQEFAYPESYKLQDIFLKAAANIIAAPVLDNRLNVVKHSLVYKFSDPKIESLSSLEKQMLRMGPENSRKIQNKFRQLVEALTQLDTE